MELKNLEPKTVNDFTIAMLLDSCEEVFESDIYLDSVNEITDGSKENKL